MSTYKILQLCALIGCLTALLASCSGSGSVTTAKPPLPPVQTYALKVNFFGTGTVTSEPVGVTCMQECTNTFPAGSTVVLTAQPGANETFANWDGCDSTSGDQCTVTLNADRLVLVTFASSAPIQLHSDVQVLSAATLNAMTGHMENTYYFAPGTSAISALVPGEVIVGHSGSNGVLARVVSVTTLSNGTIEVVTSPARLSDVIASGTVAYSQPLQVSQIITSKMRLSRGVRLVTAGSTSNCGSSQGDLFVFQIDRAFPSSGGPNVTLNGCFSMTIMPDIAVNFGLFGLQQMRVAFITQTNQQLGTIVSAPLSERQSYPIADIPLADIAVTPFLWFTPTLDVSLGVNVSANGSVQTSVTMGESLTAGVQYLQGSGWGSVWSPEFSPPSWQAPQFQASATATGYVLPEFSVQIDELAGPFLSAKGYVEGDAWAQSSPSVTLGYDLYDGLDVQAGLEADPLGWNLGMYSVTLYSNKNLLLSGSTGTPQDTAPPSVPQNVTADAVSSSQVNVQWDASTDDAAVKDYKVYQNGSYWQTVTGTFASNPAAVPDTEYCYYVEAVDVGGNISNASNTACAKTPPVTDNTPPTEPTGLTASAISNDTIALSWQASSDPVGVTGYTIDRNGEAIGSSTTTSYKDGLLAANTKYCYTVVAYDSAGNVSSPSTEACATTMNSASAMYAVGTSPSGIAIDASGNVWVANHGSNNVTELTAQGAFINSFSVGAYTSAIAIDASGNVWVTNYLNNNVMELSPNGVIIGTYAVGVNPIGLGINSAGDIWVVNNGSGTVTELSPTGTTIGTFAVGTDPYRIAFDASGDAWVTNGGDNTVTELSPSGTTIGTFAAGSNPRVIAIDPSGYIWITDNDSDTVTELNSNGATIGTYTVGQNPRGIAIDASGNVWVANEGSDTVMELSPTGAVLNTYSVGTKPIALSIDTSGNVWVANYGGTNVSILYGVTKSGQYFPYIGPQWPN